MMHGGGPPNIQGAGAAIWTAGNSVGKSLSTPARHWWLLPTSAKQLTLEPRMAAHLSHTAAWMGATLNGEASLGDSPSASSRCEITTNVVPGMTAK